MKALWHLHVIAVLAITCVFQVLCNTFTPISYDVNLNFSKFSADTNRAFDGVTFIYFHLKKGTSGLQSIVLDSELLKIDYNVEVFDSNTLKKIPVINVMDEVKELKLYIRLKIDDSVEKIGVRIKYTGTVGNAGDTGVYMTDKLNIIATNSYPLGVRKIFPCVNEPNLRTPIQLNVTLVNDKWGIHSMADSSYSPPLPVHAFGFIMTYRYRKVDDISTDRFNVWIPNDDPDLYSSVNSNWIMKAVLAEGNYFEKFVRAASMDTVHIVMIPGIPQLTLVSHKLISIRPDFLKLSQVETGEEGKGTAVVALNALSKLFFRCVVPPSSWQDFWLSDSLALYLQYALLNSTVFKDPNYPELFVTDLQRPAMRGSSSVVVPDSLSPAALTTDSLYPPAYQGASTLKMLESLSSQEGILNDLFNYYNSSIYKCVDTEDFLNFMNNGSIYSELNSYGNPLSPILYNWLHRTGYPSLRTLFLTDTGFSVSQECFMNGWNSSTIWVIPFKYSTANDPYGQVRWLSTAESEYIDYNLGPWVQLNKGSKGMFRVNYGEYLYPMLDSNSYLSLSGEERAALVDDAFELAWQNVDGAFLGYALSLVDMLSWETDYVPFSIAMSHVNLLRHHYAQLGVTSQLKARVAEVLYIVYSHVSWAKDRNPGLGLPMWVRTAVESTCDYHVPACWEDAMKASAEPSKLVNDLLPTVNCYEVRKSRQMDWSSYFSKLYNKEDSQYARADALYALACSESLMETGSSAISEYLRNIASDAILPEDASRAFSYIYSRPEHLNQTFTFIHDNFFTLLSRFKDDFMAELISDISKLLLPQYYTNLLNDMMLMSQMTSKTYYTIVKVQGDMSRRDKFARDNKQVVLDWIASEPFTFRPVRPSPQPSPTTPAAPTVMPTSAASGSLPLALLLLTSLLLSVTINW